MANVGKPWTSEQEQELLNKVKILSINDCAVVFGRTEGALNSRLSKIALEMYKNGSSVEEICNATTLSTELVKRNIYIDGLPNYKAEWDEHQDIWLKKYIQKFGIDKCACKMGRLDSEIKDRLLCIAINDTSNGFSIEDVCSRLCLSIEHVEKSIQIMNDYIPFSELDKIQYEPPYYAVLNGRNKGVYKYMNGVHMAVLGIEYPRYKKCKTLDDVRQYIRFEVDKDLTHVSEEQQDVTCPDMVNDNKQNTPPLPSAVSLSEEQQRVVDDVFSGKNVLLLGSAGVGKSFIIKHITRICKQRGINIGITSSTGCSAVLIDGRTVHSYLGIGLAKESPMSLAKNIFYKNKKKATDLQKLDILLIDEISMLDAELLTKISKYLSILRDNIKPFGGVQIILSGDFYQLPPVKGEFAFKSEVWSSANMACHVLKKIYRQEGDIVFQGILERAKDANITDEDIKVLEECKGRTFKTDVKPTSLYPNNATVDKINNEAYNLLIGREMVYNTVYSSKESKAYCDSIKVPESVKLKVGTQVMVTRNVNTELKLANGTRGVVSQMYNDCVIIKTLYGDRSISRFECVNENDKHLKYAVMPLALAWALTIHKAQGVTLDCCTIDIGKTLFEYGQAYTALSRVKSLTGLSVVNIEKSAFKTHSDVIDFYKKI